MNRGEKARDVFLRNVGKKVTIHMLQEEGIPFYTCRNGASDAKKLLEPMGYSVRHVYSESGLVGENGWVCEKVGNAQMELLI